MGERGPAIIFFSALRGQVMARRGYLGIYLYPVRRACARSPPYLNPLFSLLSPHTTLGF